MHRSITESFGLETNVDLDAAFGASVPHWPAFPDTADALRVLKRHYKLVILSNVHRDGIAASTRKLGVEFDAIYTAEDIGFYNPADANFAYLLAHLKSDLGLDRARSKYSADPQVSIVQQVVTVTANRSQPWLSPNVSPLCV